MLIKTVLCVMLATGLCGCSLARVPHAAFKTIETTVETAGKVVDVAGKVIVAGGQVAGKVVDAGGKVAETAIQTSGIKNIVVNNFTVKK